MSVNGHRGTSVALRRRRGDEVSDSFLSASSSAPLPLQAVVHPLSNCCPPALQQLFWVLTA